MGGGAKSLWLAIALLLSSGGIAAPQFRSLPELPPALRSPNSWGRLAQRLYSQFIEIPTLIIQQAAHGFRLLLPEALTYRVEGMPEIPIWVRRYSLPAGVRGRALVHGAEVEQSDRALPLAPVLEPHVWSHQLGPQFKTLARGRYFPGKWVESRQRGNELFVTLFPVQWDRETRRLVILRRAQVEIETEKISAVAPTDETSTLALIITTESLREAAQKLQAFHQDRLGISSQVATVEAIEASEPAISEGELPEGYRNQEAAFEVIHPWDPSTGKGYHYDRARRLIHYLRRQMDSGLRYVVLLGDADTIPPSYYYASRPSGAANWLPTDQCYGSRERCLEPRLAVGRLPFHSAEAVRAYIAKAERWVARHAQAQRELIVLGGKAFPGDIFLAELGTLALVNHPSAGWRGLQKYFRSDGNYTRTSFLSAYQQPGGLLAYHLDHGKGNWAQIDREGISSRELAGVAQADGMPIMVSIACSNAAFDEELWKKNLYPEERHGSRSVGVTLVDAVGGSVAFVGSLRPQLGSPVYGIDSHGNLELRDVTYGLRMLTGLVESYATGGGRLGDLFLSAQKSYAFERGYDMSHPRHQWTYLNTALLGDPVLPLPRRDRKEQVEGLAKSTTSFDAVNPPLWPRFDWPMAGGAKLLSLEASARITAKLIRLVPGDFDREPERVDTRSFGAGAGQLPFVPEPTGERTVTYLWRLENSEGVPVERQVWFQVGE